MATSFPITWQQTMQSGYMANFAPSSSAYLNALNALQSSQSQWALNQSEATNPYTAASTQQASQASGTNYAKYLAQAASQLATGSNSTSVKNNLMDLTNALQSLMALFVEHISTLSADITSLIKSKVTEWMMSQASFIKALFGNICWES